MGNIIFGCIVIAFGVLMVMKTEGFLGFFGRIETFENWFGVYGGSRIGYKLLGVFVIFMGALILTGMMKGFMIGVLSPLFTRV